MKKQKRFSRLFMTLFLGFFSLMISSCDEQDSNISSNGTSNSIEHVHEWNEGEVFLEATCQKEGLIIYTCLTCEEEKYVKTDPLGHNIVVDEAKEATCTTTGLTEGKHCDRCGEVLVYQQQIGTVAHKETIIPAVEATCSSTGLTEGKKCSECDMILVYQQVVPVLEHKIVVDEAKEATCESSGLTVGSHCSECNKVIIEQIEIPALSHDYGSLIAKVDATCENEGTISHYKCENCNSYFNENKEAIDNIVIPATGHKFDKSNWISDETGHWYECTNCGEKDSFSSHKPNIDSVTEYDDKVCTICEYIIEEALGHTHTMSYTKAKKETCESNGNIAYYYCAGCKKYYSDKDGTNVISSSSIVKKATGHNYKAEEVKPTCEEQGYTIHTCSYCYDYYIDSYVEPTGHNYNTVVTEPTCTSQGYTTHTCEGCGDTYVNSYTEVKEHNYSSVVTEPTCASQGYTTHTCEDCGDSYVDSYVEATGHTYSNELSFDNKYHWYSATCEHNNLKNSYEKHIFEGNHCRVCEYFYETMAIATLYDLEDDTVVENIKGVITHINGRNIVIEDEFGDAVLIYDSNALIEANVGETILISGTKVTYNGYPELKALTAFSIISGSGSIPMVTPIEVNSENVNEVWIVENNYKLFRLCTARVVSINSGSSIVNIGGVEITLYKAHFPDTVEVGDCVNIVCSMQAYMLSAQGRTTSESDIVEIIHNHTYISKTTESTCTSQGYTTHTCEVCGDSYVDSYAELINHNFVDGYCSMCNQEYYTEGIIIKINQRENYSYVSDYEGTENDVIIPSTYNGYPVTNIGGRAFEGCSSLTSITIPESVTSIGYNAFYGCSSLESITIPNSVMSIGNSVFYDCNSLTSITIPESVDSIGSWVFSNCSSLEIITIPESVTSIGCDAFYCCSSLIKVYYIGTIGDWCSITFDAGSSNPLCNGADLYINNQKVTNIEIPDSVTSIGNSAFYGCSSLISIAIPDSVTSIGYYTFEGCTSLTSITIGNSVTSIGNYAFEGCSSLNKVYYTGTIEDWCNIDFKNDSSNPLCNEAWLYINNEKVNEIIISNEITSIGNYAFYNCISLTNVTISDGVTSIGDDAFRNCISLISITIPDSVTNIGDSAFRNSSSLTKVYYTGTIEDWCDITFDNSSSNPLCNEAWLYINNEKVNEIIISNEITSIGNYAFYHCTSLTSITIPKSVTKIGKDAFQYCWELSTVYYNGSEEQWNEIFIASGNNYLLNAEIIFNNEN